MAEILERNLVALKVWATDEEYEGWAYYLFEETSYPWGMKRISLGAGMRLEC